MTVAAVCGEKQRLPEKSGQKGVDGPFSLSSTIPKLMERPFLFIAGISLLFGPKQHQSARAVLGVAALLTSFGRPQRDEVVGVVDPAQTLHLHFHLVGAVGLEHFQNAVGLVAVGLQDLPDALTDRPARESHTPPVRTGFGSTEHTGCPKKWNRFKRLLLVFLFGKATPPVLTRCCWKAWTNHGLVTYKPLSFSTTAVLKFIIFVLAVNGPTKTRAKWKKN